MEKRIVECVPNFSEGRDKAVIGRIAVSYTHLTLPTIYSV